MENQGKTSTSPGWLEARLSAPAPQSEAAADFLTSLTGHGVQILDELAPTGPVTVVAFFEAGAELPAQKAQLEGYARSLAAEAGEGAVELTFSDLAAEDWAGAWKAYFHPRLVSRRLIVAPPWEKASPEPGQMVIVIDPGQAFGTGQHQSTQLVLRRIERLAERGRLPARVLDVGCGSGILGLATLLFGAQQVTGIDIDPEAVAATQANAKRNGLERGLTASMTPLDELSETYPLVLANLIARELIALAQPLAQRLSPGGELVISGILIDQIGQMSEVFAAQGLKVVEQDSLAEWAALVLA
ncbi:MAG: 50S ribosomal protein L11 methyltransferase [Proteobacteria bacterium]|nr:50S ribosomal protein L11 methyltransferase [Pseudomonadota bacterium]MBU1452269.1 50S ribosomal protein L11 methyltransferase [Pseudomonadota bacterium]MBU2467170.1 50S ribosomal protein L11 methyltransferase [Pseudomonadota bacterium]MBU2516714.1 50S ribosomal protein L11 methyltransferase [Pseudomonadota bacterium]